jgi:hypothetical protein
MSVKFIRKSNQIGFDVDCCFACCCEEHENGMEAGFQRGYEGMPSVGWQYNFNTR